MDIHRSYEQTIDTVSADTLIEAGFTDAEAVTLVQSFQEFIKDNRDEITALQVLYRTPIQAAAGLRRHQDPGRRPAVAATLLDS